jgi:hypothetical protein
VTARNPYQYVVLRCVPRVDREEFLNLGVVLYSQQADFLGCAAHLDEERVRAFAPELDLAAVRSALATIEHVCAGDGSAGDPAGAPMTQRFGFLSAPRSTVVQPGPIHGGTTTDPRAELDRLVGRLVT